MQPSTHILFFHKWILALGFVGGPGFLHYVFDELSIISRWFVHFPTHKINTNSFNLWQLKRDTNYNKLLDQKLYDASVSSMRNAE